MSAVEINIMRSDGETFEIDGKTWDILSDGLTGFDTTSYEFFTDNKYLGDGTFFTGERANAREVTIKTVLKTSEYIPFYREKAITFFNPKFTFDVYIIYMGKTRLVSGKLIGFSCPNRNINRRIELTMTFLSEIPYLKSLDQGSILVSDPENKFEFPYISPVDVGFVFGINAKSSKTIEITGDVETPILIQIQAVGAAEGITFTVNGNSIKFNGSLISGDNLEFDFTQKPPKITKNGTNVIGLMDRTSDFSKMIFKKGLNSISYSADSGEPILQVLVKYNNLYLGI